MARACIDAQLHYVDLADARRFVTGFAALDADARAAGVLAVSDASSVPALPAAVVDHLLPEFSALHGVDIGINPGNQTARGLATVQSILSYCGQPFRQWHDGQWRTVYGWQGLTRRRYPAPMGRRWMGYCDVPDLELFPQRYPGVCEVVFRAGLEIPLLHLGTWLLSWLVRAGLVNNWRTMRRHSNASANGSNTGDPRAAACMWNCRVWTTTADPCATAGPCSPTAVTDRRSPVPRRW